MLVLLIFVLIFIIAVFYVNNKKENFESYSIDAMDSELKYEVEELLKKIVDDINKKHNKNLLVSNSYGLKKHKKK